MSVYWKKKKIQETKITCILKLYNVTLPERWLPLQKSNREDSCASIDKSHR